MQQSSISNTSANHWTHQINDHSRSVEEIPRGVSAVRKRAFSSLKEKETETIKAFKKPKIIPPSPLDPRHLLKIRKAAQKRALNQINQEHEKCIKYSSGGPRVFELTCMGNVQNAVAYVPQPFYIPCHLLRGDNSWDFLDSLAHQIEQRENDETIQLSKAFFSMAKKVAFNFAGTDEEKLRKILRLLDQFILDIEKNPALNLDVFYHLNSVLGNLLIPAEYASILIHYQKEGLISKFRLLKACTETTPPLCLKGTHLSFGALDPALFEDISPDQIDEAIRVIQNLPPYIPEDRINTILNHYPKLLKHILNGLTTYYSSYEWEIEGISPVNPEAKLDQNGFFIKQGLENRRELLAQRILISLGLSDHVLTKVKARLPYISLGREINPKGLIAGKRLENDFHFHPQLMNELISLYASLEQKQRNEQRGEVWEEGQATEEVTRQIIEKEEEIRRGLGFKPDDPFAQNELEEAIQTHAFNDLLLCSTDSTPCQYLYPSGHPICVDFARFLPPSPFYVDQEGNLKVVFRSFFLDHPSSKKILPPALITKIKNWDIEKLESIYRKEKLIGKLKEFRKIEGLLLEFNHERESLEALNDQYEQTRDKEILNRIMDRYQAFGLKHNLKLTGDWSQDSKLTNRYLTQRDKELKEKCFKKIHPQAFKEFKERLILLQHYVVQEPFPNLKGILELFYPELSLFMKTLSMWELQPSLNITFIWNLENEVDDEQSLDDILNKAKEMQVDQSELERLEEAKNRIRLKALYYPLMATSMNT